MNWWVRNIKKFVEFWIILITRLLQASLVGIPIGITSSAFGIRMCVITSGIKKYKSINKKNKRNMIK